MRTNRRWFVAGPILLILPLIFAVYATGDGDHEAELSGTISSTLTIFDNTRLVGDVTCAVPLVLSGANPCIAFGVDHIKLKLNGHTITGPVTPPAGCSLPVDSMYGVGIEAIDRTDVKIEGPGVIQRFERWGILLGLTGHPSSHVTVRKVTVYRNCWSGMQTFSTSDSNFEDNVWANNAVGSNGAACGGICLFNSNVNRLHRSTFYGNGTAAFGSAALGNVDFGIGFEGTSSGNRVEENNIGGNVNGVLVFATTSGNVIRHNIIVGNPPAQVSVDFPGAAAAGADIHDRSATAGANTYEDNFCLTYIGPGTAPCPNVVVKGDDKDE